MAKKTKSEASWEQIGKMIGKKVGNEFEDKKGKGWQCWPSKDKDNGFFGRALFIIGVLIALNTTGALEGVSIWIQILIGAGFAFMKL